MYREILQTVPHAVISIQVLASNYVCALNKMVKNRKSRWCKATEGFVTMNVDAGFDVNNERGANGACTKNDRGILLLRVATQLLLWMQRWQRPKHVLTEVIKLIKWGARNSSTNLIALK